MRPLGSDTYLTIKVTDVNKIYPIREQFIKSYKKRFGFYPENSEIEVVNIRTEVSKIGLGRFYENIFSGSFKKTKSKPKPDKFKKVFFSGSWIKTPVFYRKTLNPNFIISGPAVIVDDFTTVIVEPGFTGSFNQAGHLEILAANIIKSKTSEKRDPILLEIFNHRFMSIAEQMGYTLANSAHSINIKERLDFSCAIFDARGELVANAQHIPVHIGSMGDSVKTVLSQNKNTLKKGDVFLINNPHNGGSHLPDITAVSPVIINNKLVFFVATRGHHSDIGGITPGSMSSTATTLEEEGVVIDKFLLVRDGAFFQEEISTLLSSGLYPARNIPERVSDLRAQCAANAKGIQILEQLVDEMSLNVVTAYMQHIQDNATEAMEEALNIFLGNKKIYNKKFIDTLDGGQKICVEIIISRSDNRCRIKIDFSGTSSEIKENLNTPSSVVKSAVLYVLRTLIMKNIPLNSGCFRPVDIIIPKDSLLNPSSTAAVAGGNVETSQRIVDVLYGALELTAASQGTMNNFTFGLPDGSGKQYYETIAGGSGATNGHHGASAVQVHMTNTRITDPEVLEQRFPDIRIEKFAIRKNSGGDGKWIGGDGVERAIRFLKTMKVSLLTERRVFPPYGMKYGNPGKIGKNILIQEDGQEIKMDGTEEQTINPGEKIVIKTPGGGGYGKRT
ncbi:MAG: hypothetical protein HOB21_04900 [Candidatus Marinimicrobia bacterium]|nr:hypothetical protein [Candidatus Neomarinimicrobiota bacterium]